MRNEATRTEPTRDLVGPWLYVAGIAAVVVATSWAGHTCIRQVRGVSMEPTIADRAYVVVWPATVETSARGDVVLLRFPWTVSADAVKRLVGVPGDCIATDGQRVLGSSRPCITVTAGRLFVAGDNRALSTDSRQLGMVARHTVAGRVMGVLWPPSQVRWLGRPF